MATVEPLLLRIWTLRCDAETADRLARSRCTTFAQARLCPKSEFECSDAITGSGSSQKLSLNGNPTWRQCSLLNEHYLSLLFNPAAVLKVLPRLRKVTKDRIVCIDNVDFDRGVILGDTARVGKKPVRLEPATNWFCLMEAYVLSLGAFSWLRLGGCHRAAGDCAAAREALTRMAQGRGTVITSCTSGPGDPVPGPPAGTAPEVELADKAR
ncbi:MULTISPECIES: hypothetical protein [unclassified Streptomyces]|uniref:hypothetical protein n=1 Tax=unclassified Streptomyces TaxID=2593676 RepID=UPI0038300C53